MYEYEKIIAGELNISPSQVKAVAELLDGGATIPFIARYRKEAHGSLDEVAIIAVSARLGQLRELGERREAILKSLRERGILNPDLEGEIAQAPTLSRLEDLYLPYRPKKRTRAMAAREKGLEDLARLIMGQAPGFDPEGAAQAFINPELGVNSREEALSGARDIVAELVNEDADTRAAMRRLFSGQASFISKVVEGREEDGAKYRDYFDWSEAVSAAAGHRILAMRRGEKEEVLHLRVMPEPEAALALLRARHIINDSQGARQMEAALEDCYKRLLGPAMETEIRLSTRVRAESEAIEVFSRNLRELLLAAPLGGKRVLALDPGYRSGCKLALLNAQGDFLAHDLIYIMSDRQREEAGAKIRALCEKFQVEAIAVGNGTAGRETEALLRTLDLAAPVVMVSENGASVYSASEAARQEFPDLDLTVRGAVSIGRRLMDPLAELVKIDPKSIGVGQYQHDVDQKALRDSLQLTVESCVNQVGVEINTASVQILSYISGLNNSLAANIVAFRESNGPFLSRAQLKKVPRLGPKAFEQAAGFLRIRGAANPLDASAVHPESYFLVEAMAQDLGCRVEDLLNRSDLRERINPGHYVDGKAGLPTINDILRELAKPGRDPRLEFKLFSFSDMVKSMEDLIPGMRLPGLVTNITNFGAFVDIGVHQDGLVHISKLSGRYVDDPHKLLKVGQEVTVTVLEVDHQRRRISLSMRPDDAPEAPAGFKQGPGAEETAEEGRGKPRPRREKPPEGKAPGRANMSKPFNNPFARLLGGE
ncbi:MAG: RNA-binding transcriptional accessory protein [Desulfarculales bacterium]|jgi:uncharacterized protein|nr:RNA-binding transcriptional accessory protein [Desulfarculales bacterium]